MKEQSDTNDNIKWRRLVENHMKFLVSLNEFFSNDVDRVTVLRGAFQSGDVPTFLYVARNIPVAELIQLFDQLVYFSTSHRYAGAMREIILSLPREWVLSNIERTVDPLLAKGIDDDYRRILELLFDLDRELAHKYAQKATDHPDTEIQEVGQDFLERLGNSGFDS